MQSAGNDIVALCSINKERTNNKRFYRQILSTSEQELFHARVARHLSFEKFVWLAWSVKESAYKYFKRADPELIFSPTKIIVQDFYTAHIQDPSEACYQGSFRFEKNLFHFQTKITDEWIASIVSDDEHFDKINWGIRKTNSLDSADQSKQVRAFVLEALSTYFPGKDLGVSISNGQYPIITHEGKDLGIPASFSHHRPFVSYAFISPLTSII